MVEPPPSLSTIVAMIEHDLPGWSWLVRSDGPGRYFANVTSPDFQCTVYVSMGFVIREPQVLSGFCAKVNRAGSAEDILADAYNNAVAYQMEKGR